MDVSLIVPDDLIVKATSLQTPGSPVSIGAFTITMGGDLRATKEPGGRVRLAGGGPPARRNPPAPTPPPPDPADIMSLIMFNQPINQLGEGQQIALADRAQ